MRPDASKKNYDPESKNITHYVFVENGIRYAFPIADIAFSASTTENSTGIQVHHTILDKTYATNKVRAVTPIEVAKFLHGFFDPFKDIHGKRED